MHPDDSPAPLKGHTIMHPNDRTAWRPPDYVEVTLPGDIALAQAAANRAAELLTWADGLRETPELVAAVNEAHAWAALATAHATIGAARN